MSTNFLGRGLCLIFLIWTSAIAHAQESLVPGVPQVMSDFSRLLVFSQQEIPGRMEHSRMVAFIGWGEEGFLNENRLKMEMACQVEQNMVELNRAGSVGTGIFIFDGIHEGTGYIQSVINDYNRGVDRRGEAASLAVGIGMVTDQQVQRLGREADLINPKVKHLFIQEDQGPKSLGKTLNEKVALLVEHASLVSMLSEAAEPVGFSKLVILGGGKEAFVAGLQYVYLASMNPDLPFHLEVLPDAEPYAADKDTGVRGSKALLVYLHQNPELIGENLKLTINYKGVKLVGSEDQKGLSKEVLVGKNPVDKYFGTEQGRELLQRLDQPARWVEEISKTAEAKEQRAYRRVNDLRRQARGFNGAQLKEHQELLAIELEQLNERRSRSAQQERVARNWDRELINKMGIEVFLASEQNFTHEITPEMTGKTNSGVFSVSSFRPGGDMIRNVLGLEGRHSQPTRQLIETSRRARFRAKETQIYRQRSLVPARGR